MRSRVRRRGGVLLVPLRWLRMPLVGFLMMSPSSLGEGSKRNQSKGSSGESRRNHDYEEEESMAKATTN